MEKRGCFRVPRVVTRTPHVRYDGTLVPQFETLGKVQTTLDALERLIEQARAASETAYCPYSQFPVGAALTTRTGHVFAGCNVENRSAGLTICAERSAISQMVAAGERDIEVLVIYTRTSTPTPPCGGCRQVIHEFASKARIISVCDGPDRIDTTLEQLLPLAFGSEFPAQQGDHTKVE